MLESQARMIAPPRLIGVPGGVAENADRPVNFQFQIGWSFLFSGLETAKPNLAVALPERRTPSRTTGRGITADPQAFGYNTTSGSTAQWEMVVPKMVRPTARISAAPETPDPPETPAPAALRPPPLEIQLPEQLESLDCDMETDSIREDLSPPAALARWPGGMTLAAKLFLGAVVAAGIAIPVVTRISHPRSKVAEAPAANNNSAWTREPSSPAGAKQPRQLVLYRPTMGATDGRLEFTWKPGDGAVGWIFRVKDKDNYYAMAIKSLRPGSSPAFSVEHFTVYKGTEGPHATKMIILAENKPALQIRMDVNAAIFKLYVEGKVVESWTDNRLLAGGLGFLDQPDRPGEVQSVRMAFSGGA